MRRRFDPLATFIAAHVTVVFPFVSELSAHSLRAHIESAVERMAPFEIRLDGVTIEPDGVVLLRVTDGAETVRHLHARLYAGPLTQYLSRVHSFVPHVTIGRLSGLPLRDDALREAVRGLPAFLARVDAASVFRVGDDGAGITELQVPLAATPGGASGPSVVTT